MTVADPAAVPPEAYEAAPLPAVAALFRVTFDDVAKAGYLYVQPEGVAVARTLELAANVHIDVAADGSLVGVEWLGEAADAANYAVLIYGWPLGVAEGRRQAAEAMGEAYTQWGLCDPDKTHNASAWMVGPGEERVRRMAATSHRGYVVAHRLVGEWIEQSLSNGAARIAEGNTEPHHDRSASTVPS